LVMEGSYPAFVMIVTIDVSYRQQIILLVALADSAVI
jgi:hypothetical protein